MEQEAKEEQRSQQLQLTIIPKKSAKAGEAHTLVPSLRQPSRKTVKGPILLYVLLVIHSEALFIFLILGLLARQVLVKLRLDSLLRRH